MAPSSIADAPRQRALASARRLTLERAVALAAAGVLALLGLVVLALAPTGGHGGLLAMVWLATSLAGVGWLAYQLIPRHTADQPTGVPINVVAEPELHAWAVELAHRIGVDAPDSVRLAPGTGAWLDDIDGDPALVIGAASIGWLGRDELERTVGLELAMLRVREEDAVLSALRLSRSLRVDVLRLCTAPVVGGLVRQIGRRLAARCDELQDACVDWGVDEARSDLTPTEADVKEATLVDEAWDLLSDRWLAPAARRGLTLDTVIFAHREMLTACEDNGLIERQWLRDQGQPALALLSDAVEADRILAEWNARRLPDGGAGVIGWDDYVERVVIPDWRQSTAEAISAVSAATGRAVPATLEAMIGAIDAGLGAQVGVMLLGPLEDEDGTLTAPSSADVEVALADAIAHAASLAVADAEIAVPTIDVLWGITLCDDEDKDLEVDAKVRAFVAAGDVNGLRWYLQGLGLDTSRTIDVDGHAELGDLEPEEPMGRRGLALLTRSRS